MSLLMLFDGLLHRLGLRKVSIALADSVVTNLVLANSFVTTVTMSDALVTSLVLTDEDCD